MNDVAPTESATAVALTAYNERLLTSYTNRTIEGSAWSAPRHVNAACARMPIEAIASSRIQPTVAAPASGARPPSASRSTPRQQPDEATEARHRQEDQHRPAEQRRAMLDEEAGHLARRGIRPGSRTRQQRTSDEQADRDQPAQAENSSVEEWPSVSGARRRASAKPLVVVIESIVMGAMLVGGRSRNIDQVVEIAARRTRLGRPTVVRPTRSSPRSATGSG